MIVGEAGGLMGKKLEFGYREGYDQVNREIVCAWFFSSFSSQYQVAEPDFFNGGFYYKDIWMLGSSAFVAPQCPVLEGETASFLQRMEKDCARASS